MFKGVHGRLTLLELKRRIGLLSLSLLHTHTHTHTPSPSLFVAIWLQESLSSKFQNWTNSIWNHFYPNRRGYWITKEHESSQSICPHLWRHLLTAQKVLTLILLFGLLFAFGDCETILSCEIEIKILINLQCFVIANFHNCTIVGGYKYHIRGIRRMTVKLPSKVS